MLHQDNCIYDHRSQQENSGRDNLQQIRNLLATHQEIDGDRVHNKCQQRDYGFRRPHREKEAESVKDKTRKQDTFDIPALAMKSAAVRTLDQKTIPTIPLREGKALTALQTRLERLSLFRLFGKKCAWVSNILICSDGAGTVQSSPASLA